MSDLFFHQNWNFDGFCKNLLQTKSVLIASLNFLSLMVLWIRRRHRKESTYSTTCQKKGICSDSNWRAQPVRKSLETISGVILNQLQPKFAAKTVENEKLWLKAMYRLVLTGLSLFNSFFFSNMLKKNNWPTITNSILKIFPKFQDLTFDFPDDDEMAHLGLKDLFRISSSHTSLSEVYDLLYEHCSEKSTSNLCPMWWQACLKNTCFSSLTSIFSFSNQKTKI